MNELLELDKVYNEDCLDVLKRLPDECIDLLVTDCPYRIVQGGCTTIPRKDEPKGIFNRRNTFTQDTAKSGKLFKHNDIEFEEWLPEVYRVMKQNTHSYIMINARNLKELQVECEKVGFEFQQLLVWEKGNATPNRYYLNAYECILMLKKGNAKSINNMGMTNLLKVPNIKGNKIHPTQKPVDLMRVFVENSSDVGDVVLDPFARGRSYVSCQ